MQSDTASSKRYPNYNIWCTQCTITACKKHRYTARLIKADVKRPLLGSDFLRHHNLLVDVRGQRLIEADTYSSVTCHVTSTRPDGLALIDSGCNQFRRVLTEFPAILQPTFSCSSVPHGVKHYITTSGPPVHARARRLSPDKLAVAKEEFHDMERMGIIRKSNSRWASPLHHHCITTLNHMVGGVHVVITVGSTMLLHLIVIPLLICKTFLPNWPVKRYSPKLI